MKDPQFREKVIENFPEANKIIAGILTCPKSEIIRASEVEPVPVPKSRPVPKPVAPAPVREASDKALRMEAQRVDMFWSRIHPRSMGEAGCLARIKAESNPALKDAVQERFDLWKTDQGIASHD